MSRTVQDLPRRAPGATPGPGDLPAEPSSAPVPDRFLGERWAWTLVWLGLVTGGVNVWGFWWSSALAVVAAGIMILGGAAGMVATWLVPSPRAHALQWLALAGALVCVVLPQAIVIHTSAVYHTDSAAFDDVSAHALAHGQDPYTASMAPAALLLRVPDRYWTYTVNGGHVAHASYPAGSFLVDMPALLLGVHHHVVDWVDLAAWVLTGLLLFLFMPVALRWLAALVTITPIFVGMFGNSGTDAAFLPFLVIAVWRWDRFGRAGAGVARWVGPVCLGLACSIKQLPWFCVPVLAIAVYLEARADGRRAAVVAGRYVGIVAGSFVVVNLPFALWHLGPWLHGTLTPFVDPLVADGQGVVSLATHGITGGVDLPVLTLAGALAYAAVLCAFVVFYARLKRIWPLVLPVVLFFSARSLSSYLVDLFPVAVVAATTVGAALMRPTGAPALDAVGGRGTLGGRDGADGLGNGHRAPTSGPRRGAGPPTRWATPGALVVTALAGVVVVTTALAFTGAPLGLSVDAVHSSHGGTELDGVTVTVRNRTEGTVTPHFLVNTGADPNGFWLPAGGRPLVLGPGRSATVQLSPPPGTTAPQKGAHWLVEAYSGRALSTSTPQVWRRH